MTKIFILGIILCYILFFQTLNVEAAKELDFEYYYNTYTDLQSAIGYNEKALEVHYLENGRFEGRNASKDFNLRTYILNNVDLLECFGNDYDAYYEHYLNFGKQEGRIAISFEKNQIIGTYSSIYDETQERAKNVVVAANRINGILLKEGEEFSFHEAVLPRTVENGYVNGPSFASGKEVMSIGGGICQVSSTLYMAMISGMISATERYQHSLPVDYVPYGMDATIAGSVKDLKFLNAFSTSLKIEATANNGVLTVTLRLVSN